MGRDKRLIETQKQKYHWDAGTHALNMKYPYLAMRLICRSCRTPMTKARTIDDNSSRISVRSRSGLA